MVRHNHMYGAQQCNSCWWKNSASWSLAVDLGENVCKEFTCRGMKKYARSAEAEDGKNSLWIHCLQSYGRRGSCSISSWTFLHCCGRKPWQIFSIRKVEVITYVVCVLFVWDVHDCKETDGSFNSNHGHVAPPFIRLLFLHRYIILILFKREGSEITLYRLIKKYQKLYRLLGSLCPMNYKYVPWSRP